MSPVPRKISSPPKAKAFSMALHRPVQYAVGKSRAAIQRPLQRDARGSIGASNGNRRLHPQEGVTDTARETVLAEEVVVREITPRSNDIEIRIGSPGGRAKAQGRTIEGDRRPILAA